MMGGRLGSYHILCSNDLPVHGMCLVRNVLLPADSEIDRDIDDTFEIAPDDDLLARRCEHASDQAMRAETETDVMRSGLLCFRTLRSNPSAMHTIPHAPAIDDTEALTAVLEHALVDDEKTYRVAIPQTESDIGDRTIIITPTTFSYEAWRGMRRCVLDHTIVYELGDDEHTKGIAPGIVQTVLQGVIATEADPSRRYIVTSSTKDKDYHVQLLERWQSTGLVDNVASFAGDTHWRITGFGFGQLRTSYKLKEVTRAWDPLPEQVCCHSELYVNWDRTVS